MSPEGRNADGERPRTTEAASVAKTKSRGAYTRNSKLAVPQKLPRDVKLRFGGGASPRPGVVRAAWMRAAGSESAVRENLEPGAAVNQTRIGGVREIGPRAECR
jgi:hypothetical protein